MIIKKLFLVLYFCKDLGTFNTYFIRYEDIVS
jgi:hypothetical protein